MSLVLAMGWNLMDDLDALAQNGIAEAKGKERSVKLIEVQRHMIDVAKNVSYLALGVITVLSIFFQFVFTPFTLSMLNTATVSFAIMSHFYDNVGKPKNLHKIA